MKNKRNGGYYWPTKYKEGVRMLRGSLLLILLLILTITFLTFYGLNVGTFTIGVDKESRNIGIALSEDAEDTSKYTSRLLVRPAAPVNPTAYDMIDFEKIRLADGQVIEEGQDYLAYSFYIINTGLFAVDLEYNIASTAIVNRMDDAIRIMIYDEYKRTIYMKDDNTYKDPLDCTPDDCVSYFISDTVICQKQILDFRPGESRKISIVIWLEGWDEHCKDDLQGCQMRFNMQFKIYRVTDE